MIPSNDSAKPDLLSPDEEEIPARLRGEFTPSVIRALRDLYIQDAHDSFISLIKAHLPPPKKPSNPWLRWGLGVLVTLLFALNGAVLRYMVTSEHRFTVLETKMDLLLTRGH